MKTTILAASAVLSVASLVVSVSGLSFVRSARCLAAYQRCVQDCDRARDQELMRRQLQRTTVQVDLARALFDCSLQNIGNPTGLAECQEEAQAQAGADLARIDQLDERSRRAHAECVGRCRETYRDCRNPDEEDAQVDPPSIVDGGPFEIECIEDGGFVCHQPVPEICTQMSFGCDDCWKTLCGDPAWSFESEAPIEVSLEVAADPSKEFRVLSTSTRKGDRAVLPLPTGIALGKGEKLYLGFRAKAAHAGRLKVVFHRGG
jgi:hypothetical protein